MRALLELLIIGPIRAFRIMRRGSQRIAAFRATHHREPTEAEIQEISRQIEQEILHN